MNKYRPDSEADIAILKVDNRAVRRQQLDKLTRLKAERDESARCKQALDALTQYAETGTGNLLEGAVEAARAKATVGEISYALEKVYGRHRAERFGDHRGLQGGDRSHGRKLDPHQGADRSASRPSTGAVRASSSPRWARTATTAGRR